MKIVVALNRFMAHMPYTLLRVFVCVCFFIREVCTSTLAIYNSSIFEIIKIFLADIQCVRRPQFHSKYKIKFFRFGDYVISLSFSYVHKHVSTHDTVQNTPF